MMKQEIRAYYRQQADRLAAEASRLRHRSRLFVAGELLSFALAVACIVMFTVWQPTVWWFIGAGLLLVVYLLVRWQDGQNSSRIEYLENLRSVYQKELSYHSGDFSCFDDGDRYADAAHPYTFDMDIFGHDSLFQRINRTITTGGGDSLAAAMSGLRADDADKIADRREAIKELAGKETFRAEFLSHGQRQVISTEQVMQTLTKMKETKVPAFAMSPLLLAVAILSIVGMIFSIVFAVMGKAGFGLVERWVFGQFIVVYLLCSRHLRTINKMVNKIHKQLRAYIELIRLLVNADLQSAENRRLVQFLTADGHNAMDSFEELRAIVDGLDRRGNELYAFLSDAFFLNDFFLMRRFLHWQHRYLLQVEQWIHAVSRFDALISMATFRYNEPMAGDAEVVSSSSVILEATGLWHPFLGDKAVRNDFRIEDSHYYIITGANMAGKSTFLRSIGVNYLLAMNGMPVFAERFRVSVFALFSSMRTTDNLSRGISYFNAELLRLQQLLDFCRQHPRTLIILDEILKGTNSLDKLNGSRLFLQEISHLPVTGVIATHDLELSRMEEEAPDRFHNYCFEIQLADKITYSYRISRGVARNQNATYLLRNILKG